MAKIIREKYEEGVLISRETEDTGNGINYLEVFKVFLHLVVAVSVAVIAVLSVMESPGAFEAEDESGISDTTCTIRSIHS